MTKDEYVHDHHEDDILRRANVVGMKADKDDEQVRVYVTEKVPEDELDDDDIVPDIVEDYDTDVIEAGDIAAQFHRPVTPYDANRKQFHDTLQPGISIGHVNITAGTLGAFVEVDGELQILSNAHVLADTNQ
ncbi:MAG: hypothetical protein ABEJ66_01820, partial [Candidatus Nanohaloarchaea archaeon]